LKRFWTRLVKIVSSPAFANITSILAMSIATAGYLRPGRASSSVIAIDADIPRYKYFCNLQQEQWNIIASVTFTITNNGGLSTALRSVEDNPKLSAVSAWRDSKRNRSIGAVLIFPTRSNVDLLAQEELEVESLRGRRVLVNYESAPSHFTVGFNQELSTGQPISVAAGVLIDSAKGIKEVDLSLSFHFSDGKVYNKKVPISISAPLDSESCP
jgi:hypothetical protein